MIRATENFRSGSGETTFALSSRYLPLRIGRVMTAENLNLNEKEQDFIIRTIYPLFLTFVVGRRLLIYGACVPTWRRY